MTIFIILSDSTFIGTKTRTMKKEILQIKSEKTNMIAVQSFIEGICDSYNIYNYFGTISMAVFEAVENAIVHGNKEDKEKLVNIEFSQCKGGLKFQITDTGEGFEYNQYKELPEQSGSGEGLFLIQNLANKVVFSNKGSSVELTFFVNGVDVAKAVSRKIALEQYFSKQKVSVS